VSIFGEADADTFDIRGTITTPALFIDGAGGNDTVTLLGTHNAPLIEVHGGGGVDTITLDGTLNGAAITVDGDAGNDLLTLTPVSLTGYVQMFGGLGEDTLIVDLLPTLTTSRDRGTGTVQRDDITLDGEAATDHFIVNLTGTTDYRVNVHDTGARNDGADELTLNGTAGADQFLIRRNFVALLHGAAADYERVNYDDTVNGRLIVRGLGGDDRFASDDNSAITTLDGGEGADHFQIGQLFGNDRQPPNVAAGDEIATVETTHGWLSPGATYSLVAYGGTGADTFSVYSNQGEVRLEGQDGNDEFVIRAFLIAGSATVNGGAGDDTIQYNVNAPTDIDGGAGFDKVAALGTEADDAFVITDKGVFGAGLQIKLSNTEELLEVDGLEGNDTFFVLSTPEETVTRIIGGLGSDVFNVGGDVTDTIVSQDTAGRSGILNHGLGSSDPHYNGLAAALR
jgi:hypothetical protein